MRDTDTIIFVVLIIVMALFKLVKAVTEQAAKQAGSDKCKQWDDVDWEEWESGAKDGSPEPALAPVRTPARPTPPPVTTALPIGGAGAAGTAAPRPQRVDTVEGLDQALAQAQAEVLRKTQMAKAARTARARDAEVVATPETKTVSELLSESVGAAFPEAGKAVQAPAVSHRSPIYIHAHGLKNVRHGILMSEILGSPRSFDI